MSPTQDEINQAVLDHQKAMPVLMARTLIAELAVSAALKLLAQQNNQPDMVDRYVRALESELILNRDAITEDEYLSSLLDHNLARFKRILTGEHLGMDLNARH